MVQTFDLRSGPVVSRTQGIKSFFDELSPKRRGETAVRWPSAFQFCCDSVALLAGVRAVRVEAHRVHEAFPSEIVPTRCVGANNYGIIAKSRIRL